MLAGAILPAEAVDAEIAALKRRHGGRLGVAALDTGSGRSIAHRADERFALCSTFKLLMAAAVLHRVDAGLEHLARQISYDKADLLPHSPITTAHLAEGRMTVEALCEAAVTQSDNGAANLLLAVLGGPAVVTRYAVSLGDSVTRLDRTEPSLNDVPPGEVRDTTTPAAMLRDLQEFFLTKALSNESRARLTRWAKGCRTGLKRLRAGLPADWVVGDKTGSGFRNETNDIAIAWPPGRAPILIAAYYAGSKEAGDAREGVLAEIGHIVAKRFS
jgi:beta-lactamase class A